jgi:hypothetical protein
MDVKTKTRDGVTRTRYRSRIGITERNPIFLTDHSPRLNPVQPNQYIAIEIGRNLELHVSCEWTSIMRGRENLCEPGSWIRMAERSSDRRGDKTQHSNVRSNATETGRRLMNEVIVNTGE